MAHVRQQWFQNYSGPQVTWRWGVQWALCLLFATAASGLAPDIRLQTPYLGIVNVNTSTQVTVAVALQPESPNTTLYLLGIDFTRLAHGLNGLAAVVPSRPATAAPGTTVIFTLAIGPHTCPPSPAPPPGIHHVELLVAASLSPAPSDVARLEIPLVVQDLDLPPRAADWCGLAPVVSFTTDDGPFAEPSWTLAHSAALRDLGVPGTFFMTGLLGNVTHRCELARQVVADGHSVASHTYDHPDVTTLTDAELVEQLVKNDNWFRDCLGVSPRVFRPPYGKLHPRQTQLLGTLGMTVVMWRANIDDVDPATAEAFFRIQYNQLINDHLGKTPSYITISHDWTDTIPAVLETMVPFFRARNYTFVAYEQCLSTCTEHLCKNDKFSNGLQRIWPYSAEDVPAARFPWNNAECSPNPPETALPVPEASLPPIEPCLQIGQRTDIRPQLAETLCVSVFNENYAYLQTAYVFHGVATIASAVLNGSQHLVVEQYTGSACDIFLSEFTCTVVVAPSPAPTGPTLSGPVMCRCLCCVGDACDPVFVGNAESSCDLCPSSCRLTYPTQCLLAAFNGSVQPECVRDNSKLATASEHVEMVWGVVLGTVFAAILGVGAGVWFRRQRVKKVAEPQILL